MKEKRSIILSAMPSEHAELRTIFSDKPDSIRRRLENPPMLRPNGWGLRTGDQAKFIRGELVRVKSLRSTIDLYRDGTLIFGGQVNREFLAWSDETDIRLHPLAFAEVVVNFARFYKLILSDFLTAPSRLEFRIDLRNMWLGNEKTRLPGGPVTSQWWELMAGPRMEAPADTWSHKFLVPSKEYNPDRVAFQLIHELYIWFGHSEESIPYKKETETGFISDADAIANIH
jgi:hypothetical protein